MLIGILFASTALLTLMIVGAVRRWTERHQIYDHPTERSSHTDPTPRMGGLGIVGALLFDAVALSFAGPLSKAGLVVLGAALLIAAVSLVDDVRPLSVMVRLPTHVCAALIVVAMVGYWQTINLGNATIKLGIVGLPLTCLWLVGLTNVYNFMDGVDGIAGTQGVSAGLGWMILGVVADLPLIWIPGGLIAAASAGFLVENWPPARIFMGDTGSAFLGFVLAALPLLAPAASPRLLGPAVFFLWPFLFDGTFTILRRLLRRENVFEAHRSHLYQRLLVTGRNHLQVTVLYAGLDIVGIAFGILAFVRPGTIPLCLSALAVIASGFWALVVRMERAAHDHPS